MADDSVVECKSTARAAKNVSPPFDFPAGSRSFDETEEPKQEKKEERKKERERRKEREIAREMVIEAEGARARQISSRYTNIPFVGSQRSHPRFFRRQLCIRSPPCREIQGIARTNSSTSIMERDGASTRGGQKDEVIAARAERTCV